MAAIETANIFWVAVVTLLGCIKMARIARLVGNMRMKHKIMPPETTGPPEFIRSMRAQQNCIEFFILFVPLLWIAGIFFHQVPASIFGTLYIYQRWEYFNGYVREAKQRLVHFKKSVNLLMVLLVMAAAGLVNTAANIYLNKDFLAPVFRIVGLAY